MLCFFCFYSHLPEAGVFFMHGAPSPSKFTLNLRLQSSWGSSELLNNHSCPGQATPRLSKWSSSHLFSQMFNTFSPLLTYLMTAILISHEKQSKDTCTFKMYNSPLHLYLLNESPVQRIRLLQPSKEVCSCSYLLSLSPAYSGFLSNTFYFLSKIFLVFISKRKSSQIPFSTVQIVLKKKKSVGNTWPVKV